jgi:hypothetical protein
MLKQHIQVCSSDTQHGKRSGTVPTVLLTICDSLLTYTVYSRFCFLMILRLMDLYVRKEHKYVFNRQISMVHICVCTALNLLKPSGYYMHMLEHCILPTQCVCVLHMALKINSDCLHKRHEPVGLCSGDITCFL